MAGKWFRTVMSETFPRKAMPMRFSTEALHRLHMLVLLLLGEWDNLLGRPERTETLAEAIPDVTVKILVSRHFIALEKPEEVNALLIDFFR